MMTSPAYILSRYLIDLGVFTDPVDGDSWPLYVSYLPDGPGVQNNAVAIYDSPSRKDGRLMSGPTLERPGIQFILRFIESDYLAGYGKGEELKEKMDEVHNALVVANTLPFTILLVSRVSDLIPLGKEEGTKKRYKYSINFEAPIKEG